MKDGSLETQLELVEEKTVLDDVYCFYLEKEETRDAFLRIAALYQFEIPVQKQYVGDMPEDKKGLLNKFIKGGDIPTAFFAYHNSTIAEYVLKAEFEIGNLSLTVEEYTFKILMDYIRFKPANFFDIFTTLYSNEKFNLQSKIIKQEITLQVYEEIVSGYNDEELFKFNQRHTRSKNKRHYRSIGCQGIGREIKRCWS